MGKFHTDGIEHSARVRQFLRLAGPAETERSLDGTPIIASISDIDNLLSRGYITVTTRPNNDPSCAMQSAR